MKDAARLLASSSSTCFLARAWRSLHVNFLPAVGCDLIWDSSSWACACLAANGLTNFFGCNLMGVYAVPTGPILSSSSGFEGAAGAAAGADGTYRGVDYCGM